MLKYAENDEKTIDKNEKTMYVTGVNCNKETVYQEMIAVQNRFDKCTGNIAYHAYQSFKTGEVSPKLAHKIGVELAEKMWSEHQVIVATHFNTGTYHNHFVVNSVNMFTGKKFNCNKGAYYHFRELSDELCRGYGLTVIEKPRGKTPRNIYFAEKRGEPTKYNLIINFEQQQLKLDLVGNTNKVTVEPYYGIITYNIDQNLEIKAINLIIPASDMETYIEKIDIKSEVERFKSATYFRSRKTTPKKLKEAANEKVELFSEIKDFFEEYVNYPELNLPNDIELKDEYTLEDIEKIAINVREYWKLGMEPIDNLVSVLQENGIIISKIKVGNNKIDAFSK